MSPSESYGRRGGQEHLLERQEPVGDLSGVRGLKRTEDESRGAMIESVERQERTDVPRVLQVTLGKQSEALLNERRHIRGHLP